MDPGAASPLSLSPSCPPPPCPPPARQLPARELHTARGWQACGTGFNGSFHDRAGKPLINLTRFPDMKKMNTQAHAKGVKMGWYQNNCGCSEAEQFGSIGGHVKQDALATAELLFDSIKVDGCGPSQNISEWTAELNATGRPILLEDCLTKKYTRRGLPAPVPLGEVFEECPGNFFRLGSDIGPQFYSTMFNLIYTYNLMARYNSASKPASRPGCWTYSDSAYPELPEPPARFKGPPRPSPGLRADAPAPLLLCGLAPPRVPLTRPPLVAVLEVGNGLSPTESRTHFAAFAVTSSPLVLGFDLTNASLYAELYPIVANKARRPAPITRRRRRRPVQYY